nr:hypothetical protein [Desulfuromonadales bacterium]
MIFYGLMLGTGNMTLEVMPQFVISAVIFLTSGRLMKKGASRRHGDAEADKKTDREEPDWAWMTLLLNWMAALTIIGLMAIMLMKPIGVSLIDTVTESMQHKHFFADSVP